MYQLEVFTYHMLTAGDYASIMLWFSTFEELIQTAKLFVDQGYEVKIDSPEKMSNNPCR